MKRNFSEIFGMLAQEFSNPSYQNGSENDDLDQRYAEIDRQIEIQFSQIDEMMQDPNYSLEDMEYDFAYMNAFVNQQYIDIELDQIDADMDARFELINEQINERHAEIEQRITDPNYSMEEMEADFADINAFAEQAYADMDADLSSRHAEMNNRYEVDLDSLAPAPKVAQNLSVDL